MGGFKHYHDAPSSIAGHMGDPVAAALVEENAGEAAAVPTGLLRLVMRWCFRSTRFCLQNSTRLLACAV